ncbi:MAG: biotin--[acetyl-CoA-carboxylase] ligase [Thermoflexales bacterium]|nr:biotin--[acetyl-CoA-carboxylase] ligase [Thermoflexales bacterium]
MQWVVHRFDVLTSTMDQCRAYAEAGAVEGVVVVADQQTRGRGRAGRSWYSPSGQSLYLSVLLKPRLAPHQVGWLTMIGALATATSIERSTEGKLRASIKWPNDVLVHSRKVAGVLVETAWLGDTLEYAVMGIGLNVNTTFEGAPEEIRQRAISLREALGVSLDREQMLQEILMSLGEQLDHLPAPPTSAYATRIEGMGQMVRLCVGNEIVEGRAASLREDGALVVQTESGLRAVALGELLG